MSPSTLQKPDSATEDYLEHGKELYSVQSGSTANGMFERLEASCSNDVPAPPAGIDAEVADFFAQSSPDKVVVIDDATNIRLRWMVHRRVLVR